MKRILALMLAAVMLLGLAACAKTAGTAGSSAAASSAPAAASAPAASAAASSSAAASTPAGSDSAKELTLAWSGTGQDKDKFDALVAKYTEETGVKINTVFIPGTWSEYFTKIQSMIGAGENVDAAFVAIEGFNMMCDMGIAKPLNTYIDANKDEVNKVLDNLEPSLLKAMTLSDGNMYAFPTECNNIVIHCNKASFQKAGLELPKEDWTKDEFLADCKKLTYEENGVKHYAFAVPQYYFMIEGWLRNNGSAIVSDDLKTPTINSPENVETIQFLQDLIYKYGYAPIPEPNVDPIQQLMDGTVAMGSFGRWPTLSYQANDFKDAYVTKVPKFSTQQTMFGIGGVAVTSEKNYEEAAKFALWCAQDTFVKGYLSAGGIPANKAIADEIIPTEYDPENSQLFYASLKDAVPIGAPASYAEIDSIVTSALSDIFMNQADVKTTLDNAAQQMSAAMN